jgi:DNA-directed RNA polymerase subunit RPC12/RpoP
MLSALCPQCGRPAPASIASPTVLRCPACRFTGPMPAEAAHHLMAAGQMLFHANVRERQLSFAQQRTLAARGSQNLVFFLVLGVSAFPTMCMAIAQVGVTIDEVHDDWLAGCLFLVTPFFVVVGAGLALWSWMSKRRKQLEDACTASPPAAPGEPCGCHVCGAPLTTTHASAVTRCGHCGADNVVSAPALARATARRHYILQGYEEHLRRELLTVNQVANKATMLSFASALLLPPATLVLLILIVLPLIMIKRPVDPDVLYVVKRLARGDCLGKVTPKRGAGRGFKLSFGAVSGNEEQYIDAPSLSGMQKLHAQDLVGKRVVTKAGESGVVESVDADLITGNHANVRVGPGERPVNPMPEDVCFTVR